MKVVCGLGNPGGEYAATRHNAGWWVVERAREVWHFPPFQRERRARSSAGVVSGRQVRLLEPTTYMNLSGAALAPLGHLEGFDVRRDLLIVVDDAALDVGRIRFRSTGSSGGHNGLKSVETVLRTRDYPRLRIGVGPPPPGADMSEWVLEPFEEEEAATVRALLPVLVEAVELWIEEGTEAAANRFNR